MIWEYSEVEVIEDRYGTPLENLQEQGEKGWEAYAISHYVDHNRETVRIYHLRRSLLPGVGEVKP